MKGKILGFTLCLLATTAIAGGKWANFKSADGSYQISFPAAPKVIAETRQIEGRSIPTEWAVYGSGMKAFMALRFDLKSLGDLRGKEDVAFKYGLAGMTSEKGYKVYSATKFTIGGNPGMQLVLNRNGVEMQAYAVVARSQMILIAVATPPGKTDNPDSQKFIASFKLN